LQNALKYAVDTISVSLTQTSERSILTVTNNCTEDLSSNANRLFDRFYTTNLARNHGNTGIGLYLVKTLVEKMQGEILPVETANREFSIRIAFRLF
jgi:signal transduction histidine kinase